MAAKGEKRNCPTCGELVEVTELIPSEVGWCIQKLSCGHTGRIRMMDPIKEKIERKEEVKAVSINHTYGQVYAEKTSEVSRSILCKCGHKGSQHKFLRDYTGEHNCYLCKCSDYNQE
jgi:hypothetical protein